MRGHTYFLTNGKVIFWAFEGVLGIKGYVISVIPKINLQYSGCVFLYT